jgi:hypothetical protein
MTHTELLIQLLSLGVTLTVSEGKIRCQGEQSVLTPPLLAEVKAHKEALLDLLAPNNQNNHPRTQCTQRTQNPVEPLVTLSSNGHQEVLEPAVVGSLEVLAPTPEAPPSAEPEPVEDDDWIYFPHQYVTAPT